MELNRGDNKVNSTEKLTVDAIHPLFNAYRNQKGIPESEDSNRYFCKECQIYFPVMDTAIMEHFQNRTHYPIESCVYCEGPVCEYFFKNKRLFFHNCEDKKEAQVSAKNSFSSKFSCDIS